MRSAVPCSLRGAPPRSGARPTGQMNGDPLGPTVRLPGDRRTSSTPLPPARPGRPRAARPGSRDREPPRGLEVEFRRPRPGAAERPRVAARAEGDGSSEEGARPIHSRIAASTVSAVPTSTTITRARARALELERAAGRVLAVRAAGLRLDQPELEPGVGAHHHGEARVPEQSVDALFPIEGPTALEAAVAAPPARATRASSGLLGDRPAPHDLDRRARRRGSIAHEGGRASAVAEIDGEDPLGVHAGRIERARGPCWSRPPIRGGAPPREREAPGPAKIADPGAAGRGAPPGAPGRGVTPRGCGRPPPRRARCA